jgi:hypothetical protein
MSRQSKYEKLIRSWFSSDTCVVNSKKLLPSKQEVDLYFPKYKIGVEVNGAMWHSEAAGRTKYYHQEKFLEARSVGINLLSFYDWEIKSNPTLAKAMIEREMLKCYKLHLSQVKQTSIDQAELDNFLRNHTFAPIKGGTEFIGMKDKKGLAAIMGVYMGRDGIAVCSKYIERNGVHIFRGVVELTNAFINDKGVDTLVSFSTDHGRLYPHTLIKNGFEVAYVTEPNFYYLQASRMLPSNTDLDTTGYTKVYDGGSIVLRRSK